MTARAIPRYGDAMATRKVTITVDEGVLATLRVLAEREGVPLSTYVTRVAEHHARVQDGLAAMREWEDEHGAFTAEELAEARADIARAESGQRAAQRFAS